jgi:hypothetical protein
MRIFITALSLIVLTVPALAQQAQFNLGRFSFQTPLQIVGIQDSNFITEKGTPEQRLFVLSLPPSVQLGAPETGPRETSDQILMLTLPTLAYQKGARRYELTARYMPEFEIFRENKNQNAWNHAAGGDFVFFATRKLRFSVMDQYIGSQDPSRVLRNPFLLLPRSPFRQNSIITTGEFEASPLTLMRVDYSNVVSTYGQTDPFQTRILDTIANGVSFTGTRLLNRKQRISGTYSYFKIKPIDRQEINDDAVDTAREFDHPINTVRLVYRYSFTNSSVLVLSGGVSFMDNGTNYLARVAGYRRIGDFYVGGGFAREFSLVPGPNGVPAGLGAATMYDLLSARISGQISRSVGLQAEFAGTFDATKRVVNVGRSLAARARVDYRLTDRTVALASAEIYNQSLNDYVRAPLSRNRFLVGLEFSLASEVDRRTDPRNEDEQYVSLTEHARRRRLPE